MRICVFVSFWYKRALMIFWKVVSWTPVASFPAARLKQCTGSVVYT